MDLHKVKREDKSKTKTLKAIIEKNLGVGVLIVTLIGWEGQQCMTHGNCESKTVHTLETSYCECDDLEYDAMLNLVFMISEMWMVDGGGGGAGRERGGM